jgi:hypothetical protein
MAEALPWILELLASLAPAIVSWFQGIWGQVQTISNTGQGLFGGIATFGSLLWDALTKFATTFGQYFATGFSYIQSGLGTFANTYGQWLNSAYNFLASGLTWVGSNIWTLGNWVYNTLFVIANWIVNSIVAQWNTLIAWFSGVATAIGSWWASVIGGVNVWFTNLLKGFRQKIIKTIQADLTITMAWKGAERLLTPSSMKDIMGGFFGIFASPLVGELVGTIVDAVVPLPATSTYPLIPDLPSFGYIPPSISVPTPSEKPAPTPTPSQAPTGAFTGLVEPSLKATSESYEVNVMAGKDLSLQVAQLSYETLFSAWVETKTLEVVALSYEIE